MRRLIGIAAFFIALVSVLMCMQLVQSDQYNKPLGADAWFSLGLGDSGLSKDEIVAQLTHLADEHHALVLKASTDAEHYGTERNLYYFSNSAPDVHGESPLVNTRGEITWFSDGLTGHLAPASQLGNTPVGGQYNVKESPGFSAALRQWADANGLSLSYEKPKSAILDIYNTWIQSGLIYSWIGANLLVVAFILSWVLLRSKTRSIQLVGGITPLNIHREALLKTGSAALIGLALGIVASLGYVWAQHSFGNVGLVLGDSLRLIVVSLLITFVAALIFSLVLAPSTQVLTSRRMPVRSYRRSNTVVRGAAVALAAMVLPAALGSAQLALRAYQQSSDMERFGHALSVSVQDFSELDTPAGELAVEAFFADPRVSDQMMMGLDLGSAVGLNHDHLGGYSELDMVDQRYLDLLGLKLGQFSPVEMAQMPDEIRAALEGQLGIMVRPGVEIGKQVRLYSYRSTKNSPFISLGQNAAYGGKINYADHPLIVFVEDPAHNLKARGTLLPLLSTGNILFSNPAELEFALRDYGIYSSVSSIDRIADAALATGQKLRSQFTLYVVASLLILITVAVTAWQSAELWAAANRKKIFILTSAGVSVRSAYKPVLHRDIAISLGFYVLGTMLALMDPNTGSLSLILAAFAVTAAVYVLVLTICYHLTTGREFARIVRRGA